MATFFFLASFVLVLILYLFFIFPYKILKLACRELQWATGKA